MRRKWLVLVVSVVLAAFGAGIGWIYTHPPLVSTGLGRLHDGQEKTLAYGIDPENTARWPLTLTAVSINNREVHYPQALAVANLSDGQLAANAAMRMAEHGHKLKTGSVKGWVMQPQQRLQPFGSYGLRLDWEGIPSGPAEIVVNYRYLGLPMRHVVTSRWPLQN